MILVLVPVLFQLIFFGICAGLLYQAEEETKWQTRAKDTLSHTSELLNGLMEAVKSVGKYALTKDSNALEDYDQKLASIEVEFSELRKLLAGNRRALQVLEQSNSTKQLILGYLREARRQIDLGQRSVAFDQLRKLGAVADQFTQDLDGLSGEYRRVDSMAPQSQERMRHFMLAALIGGTVFSIISAFSLAFFFNKSTIVRLQTLMDNARRLQVGNRLNPPLAGTDEIASLDQTFHEMARTMTEASEKLSSVIEHMPVGLVTITRDGMIDSFNPKAEAMFGCSSNQASGKPAQSLFVTPDQSDPISFAEQLFKKGHGKIHELQGRRLSMEALFPAELAVSDLQQDGELAYLASVQDVSERHEVERIKREFMDMISHDLRSPLSSMMITLKLLSVGAYGAVSKEAQERISTEKRNCSRLIGLVTELLDLEKLGSGKLVMEPEEFPISSAIKDSVEAVAASAEQKKLSIKAPKISWNAFADQQRICQVLVNLLSNAIKFSPEGSEIQIAARNEASCLRIEVRDRGPGIPDGEKEAVFEQFHQLKTKDGGHKAGTGLGLAICKAIVEGHNGSIGVKDGSGGGAVFWFTIPQKGSAL